jgi:cation-transporting ATPase 13A3/4/5
MTGRTFEALTSGRGHPVLDRLLSKCVVFARMSPEQKQLLVEKLQGLGYHVGQCFLLTGVECLDLCEV